MPCLLRNLLLAPGEGDRLLFERLIARFALAADEILDWKLVRKGLDARHKGRPQYVCTIEFTLKNEADFISRHSADIDLTRVDATPPRSFHSVGNDERLVIAGMGPAGLFAALRLTEYGLTPILLDRGKRVEERVRDVQTFWTKGELDCESNVQFGEGGAGTFSDGKLTTRVRDANISYVLTKLVEFGAPPETAWLAKPHIGTDRLRNVVIGLRQQLESRGVQVCFQHRVTDLTVNNGRLNGVIVNNSDELPCHRFILAPGHSARDTYAMLLRRGIRLEPKPFAVGVRVEHPQELIDRIQYGVERHPALPPAEYSLTYNDPDTGRSVYSFCMCPGGMLVAGASEPEGVVTNGMSSHLRNSPHANSALVVSVGPDDYAPHPLGGVEFQRELERIAFQTAGGGYRAPAENLLSFLGDSRYRPALSSYLPGVRETELRTILPGFVTQMLQQGIRAFERKMRGFITAEATLTGVETRTSAPLRILRSDDFQSVSMPGLYPAGEGAGYAGGIMSAALDGIRVADGIARQLLAG
jgi:uncharacterized FAD-dependent dehydrogenase